MIIPPLSTVCIRQARALRRVEPYLDLLPPTVGDEVIEALAQYDVMLANMAIVQTPEGAREALRDVADQPGERYD